ncbi:phospholipase [Peribacillus glennii]|uniref:Phospholipase n=1 Tax=Peribacillus glennii TaxID=2303991 RepID=A0A372L6N5_9BACI|nr:phospholipase [Peribacillus glennii]RFU60762.1 phospholipase [Peribacillus glennii]
MATSEERGLPSCIFPGYKYCGPNCSGPGAPTNSVDNCCRKHDHCLERGGSPCKCDTNFINCLRSKMDPHTLMGRQAALMYGFMKMRIMRTCGGSNSSQNEKRRFW